MQFIDTKTSALVSDIATALFEPAPSTGKFPNTEHGSIDQDQDKKWTDFDAEHYAGLDAEIENVATDDAKRSEQLLKAKRYQQALESAESNLKSAPENASALRVAGEASLLSGEFFSGIERLEQARQADGRFSSRWVNRLVRSFDDYKSVNYGLDVHPTKELVATAHENKSVRIRRLSNGEEVHTFTELDSGRIGDVAWSQDGSRLISCGVPIANTMAFVKVTDATSHRVLHTMPGHFRNIYRIERHPTKDLVVTASEDETAKIWDIQAGREILSLTGHEEGVFGACFSPDGTKVATASEDGTVRIWDADVGKEIKKIEAHKNGAWRVDWLDEGRQVITCGKDHAVRIWDAGSGQKVAELEGHKVHVEVVRVSPDGKTAASADVDGKIFVWDLQTRKPLAIFDCGATIFNLRFHDKTLLTVDADAMLREWDIDFSRSPLADIVGP